MGFDSLNNPWLDCLCNVGICGYSVWQHTSSASFSDVTHRRRHFLFLKVYFSLHFSLVIIVSKVIIYIPICFKFLPSSITLFSLGRIFVSNVYIIRILLWLAQPVSYLPLLQTARHMFSFATSILYSGSVPG